MEKIKKTLEKLSHSSGVYIFRNIYGDILYIGKAIDLSRRVKSYFLRDDAIGPKTITLRDQIHNIDVIETTSEFDAILLEAKLIHKHSPKYNTISKDDKSPLYMSISVRETLPRIFIGRRLQVEKIGDLVIGPFQSGRTLRALLSSVRRAVPYCTQNKRNGKPCFYTHLALCNPCPSVIEKMIESSEKNLLMRCYQTNINRLIRIFEGRSQEVLSDLQKEMRDASSIQNFERAREVKMQIESLYTLLTRHHDPLVYENSTIGKISDVEVQELVQVLQPYFPDLKRADRIECIDISNFGGTFATGSLVVLLGGRPSTQDYRRFRIRIKNTPDDCAMISEVTSRRFSHSDWSIPDLLIVDGGKAQVQAAASSLLKTGLSLPIIGLAKRYEELVVPLKSGYRIIRLPLDTGAIHVVQRIRDEAHRFAKRYHIFLRSSSLIPKNIV